MPFHNPVIPGFHPDPSACRVGDDYFLVTSSFTYFPGVPIFRSTNLVDWSQIGNVLDRPSQLDLSGTRASTSLGIFAPTVRHHDGRFWMITTLAARESLKSFYVTATDPVGPWSDPVVVDVPGIDPDLSWDAAGQCFVHLSLGPAGIFRCRIDDETGVVLDGLERTWSGTGLQYPEAPHLFERDGAWYLLLAEGGTERGHAVSIARGSSPVGPWETNPANPILSHRSTDHPIQNVGHSDLIEAADGSWWLVALGVRPLGPSPMYHVLGRETFLAPVEWVDGWPVVGALDLEMTHSPPAARRPPEGGSCDDFDSTVLHPGWMSVRRPIAAFGSLTTAPARLTLTGGSDTLDSPTPALVARRQQHHWFRARTAVEAGRRVEAGLALLLDDRSHYEVARIDERVLVRARIGPLHQVVAEEVVPASGPTVLCIETARDASAPDVVRLGIERADGDVHVLAELDGRYLSTESASGFVGRVIGMYAVGGSAEFHWFDYQPLG